MRDAGTVSLVLDRHAMGNALSSTLIESLLEQVDAAFADRSIDTLMIRATGPHFCTGFDLSDLATASDGDLLHRFVRIEMLLTRLWHAPIRTVALAKGRTWGAGADLFAACEWRVATADTTFRFPGVRFGLVLGTRRLAERVGTDHARRILIEGRELDGHAAVRIGLASELVDDVVQLKEPESNQGPDRYPLADLVVDPTTSRTLRDATRVDHADKDLADLVRSAAAPGLKSRILAYREQSRKSAPVSLD